MLYPAPLRSLLMYLTLADVCDARWTDRIHDEWTRNVLANRPDLTVTQIGRTRELMDRHVPHAKVVGYEPLLDALTLPDADDRHVLAAAIHARASVIVTSTYAIFPTTDPRRTASSRDTPTRFSANGSTPTPRGFASRPIAIIAA